MDVKDCLAHLIWANIRELEPKHRRMYSSFEDMTVCWLMLKGALRFESGGKVWKVKSGEWFFPAAAMGHQRFSPGTRLLSIRFLLHFPGGKGVYSRKQSLQFSREIYPELERSARSLAQGLTPWVDRGSLLVGRQRIPFHENYRIEALFYQWLANYTQVMHALGQPIPSRQQGDARVAFALQRLEQGRFRDGFSESQLAEACGLSVNQLGLLFKRETGVTPFQYYDRLRLDPARQMLAETGMQVKEIAYELGFSSSPHFTNWFKQRHGKGPRVFRKETLGRV